MAEYIKRDPKKLKHLFREAQMFQDDIICSVGTDWMQKVAEAENKMIFDILKGLENEPSADVVEVRHGQWEFKSNGRYGQTRCYCSACGKHSGIGGICTNQLKPYCPNCGAKMDGERKEQE